MTSVFDLWSPEDISKKDYNVKYEAENLVLFKFSMIANLKMYKI